MRTSENSVMAKFAFWAFSEVRLHGVLGSSRQASEDGTMLVVERDCPPGKWVRKEKTLCRTSGP